MSEGNIVGNPSAFEQSEQDVQEARRPVEIHSELTQGTVIYQVQNLDLACCLLSVGIPLRTDPPYVHAEMKDGREILVWNFREQNPEGDMKTQDLIAAFSQDMKWIDEHPDHPFTFAMCALKNRAKLLEHIQSSTPWVAFKGRGRGMLLVKKGSNKEARCVTKGMTRIDPMKEENPTVRV